MAIISTSIMSTLMSDREPAEHRPNLRRGVVAAWMTALIIFAASAGFHALASWRTAPPTSPGVVIPQHDQTRGDGQYRGEASPFEHFDTEHYTVW
jgi:hypothetical protein